jgi:alanine dehydrogenase
VEEAFRQLALGNVVMPQRNATVIAPHHGLHLAMPAFVGSEGASEGSSEAGALSVKLVTVYPQNQPRFGLPTIQGVLLLHDAASGRPLALMDAEHITAMRTGAASGVATRLMARPDAECVLLFGAGAQARAQLAAVCAVRPIRRAYLVTRTGARDAAFCAQAEAALGIEVCACPRDDAAAVAAVVAEAAIICTATNATEPLLQGAWLRPGTHINAIGAYTRTMRELDGATLQRSRVIVDHHPAAQAEAGDLLLAIAEGAITYAQVAGDLGSVVLGQLAGRTGPEEITLFKSVGLAMQDTLTAAHLYALAQARGAGVEIGL